MKIRKTASIISKIKDVSDNFVKKELEKKGISGMVPSHGGILAALYLSGKPLTMSEAAAKINKTPATTTVLADKLLDMGYVAKEKSPEDARVTYLSLTDKGHAFRNIFFDISEDLNEIIHSGLSDLEADMLERLLEKIDVNLKVM